MKYPSSCKASAGKAAGSAGGGSSKLVRCDPDSDVDYVEQRGQR